MPISVVVKVRVRVSEIPESRKRVSSLPVRESFVISCAENAWMETRFFMSSKKSDMGTRRMSWKF